MKKSMRARRMERSHKRHGQPSKLNLVSLMDIFTILVFFLMVNHGDVEILQPDKDIQLPESVTEAKPDTNLLIKVSAEQLSIQGKKVADIGALTTTDNGVIRELAQALETLAATQPELSEQERKNGRPITIMGDQSMPYSLLKQVMSTCARTDFRDISLAVSNLPVDEAELPQLEALETAMLEVNRG